MIRKIAIKSSFNAVSFLFLLYSSIIAPILPPTAGYLSVRVNVRLDVKALLIKYTLYFILFYFSIFSNKNICFFMDCPRCFNNVYTNQVAPNVSSDTNVNLVIIAIQ